MLGKEARRQGVRSYDCDRGEDGTEQKRDPTPPGDENEREQTGCVDERTLEIEHRPRDAVGPEGG
jgi:hypothetical protein